MRVIRPLFFVVLVLLATFFIGVYRRGEPLDLKAYVHTHRRAPPPSGRRVNDQDETLAEYVWKQCQKQNVTAKPTSPSDFCQILVDDRHKMLYCSVPKVGCTNWGRVFLVLTGHVNASRMMSISPHHSPYSGMRMRLSRYNLSAIRYRLQNYFKFMVVRHPLERLLSAWRDKFHNNYSASAKFRKNRVRHILQQYPNVRKRLDSNNNNNNKSGVPLDRVMISFSEFLQFLVDRSARKRLKDAHWNLFHRMCFPCSVRYDFVGRLDTVEEDTAHVLRMVNAEGEVSFPDRSGTGYRLKSSQSLVEKHYRDVPASLLKRIVDVYETDFVLFNFSVSLKDLEFGMNNIMP